MDGILGIFGPGDPDLVNKTFLATGACQHRGKASTGLAIGTKKGIYIHKGLGRIAEVIDYNVIRNFQDLQPIAAIGNIGYTKRKMAEKTNAEPIEIVPRTGGKLKVVLTMDGYLIKTFRLIIRLKSSGPFYINISWKSGLVLRPDEN